jgi:hypothetical protein
VGVKAVPGQAPGHPQQVLVALKRYGRLLARPAVDTALQLEKQSLTDMVSYITHMPAVITCVQHAAVLACESMPDGLLAAWLHK